MNNPEVMAHEMEKEARDDGPCHWVYRTVRGVEFSCRLGASMHWYRSGKRTSKKQMLSDMQELGL